MGNKYILNRDAFNQKLTVDDILSMDQSKLSSYIQTIPASYHGFFDEEADERKEMVDDFITDWIREKLQGFKKTNILYRIIPADTKLDINLLDIGTHFVDDTSLITDVFLYDIGLDSNKKPMWLIKCAIDIKYIDVYNTILSNLEYPYENEITILPKSKVNIIDITPFKLNTFNAMKISNN